MPESDQAPVENANAASKPYIGAMVLVLAPLPDGVRVLLPLCVVSPALIAVAVLALVTADDAVVGWTVTCAVVVVAATVVVAAAVAVDGFTVVVVAGGGVVASSSLTSFVSVSSTHPCFYQSDKDSTDPCQHQDTVQKSSRFGRPLHTMGKKDQTYTRGARWKGRAVKGT